VVVVSPLLDGLFFVFAGLPLDPWVDVVVVVLTDLKPAKAAVLSENARMPTAQATMSFSSVSLG